MEETTNNDPLFSSDLAYLGRINWLISKAMECSIFKEYSEMRSILENLYIQLEPRLDNKIKKYKSRTEREYLKSLLDNCYNNPKRLIELYSELNLAAHRNKLILRDKDDGMGAAGF